MKSTLTPATIVATICTCDSRPLGTLFSLATSSSPFLFFPPSSRLSSFHPPPDEESAPTHTHTSSYSNAPHHGAPTTRAAGDLVSDRDVIALTPGQYAEMIRHQEGYTKNDMVRELFERRGEAYSPGTTLLIDDTRRNVEAFVRIGGHGLLVEGGQGLILQNAKVILWVSSGSRVGSVPTVSFSRVYSKRRKKNASRWASTTSV